MEMATQVTTMARCNWPCNYFASLTLWFTIAYTRFHFQTEYPTSIVLFIHEGIKLGSSYFNTALKGADPYGYVNYDTLTLNSWHQIIENQEGLHRFFLLKAPPTFRFPVNYISGCAVPLLQRI